MENSPVSKNPEMMVDANSTAGQLMDIFGREMTNKPTECAHCGGKPKVGILLNFMNAHGVILRCSICKEIVIRFVQAPEAIYLDARGAVFLKMNRKLKSLNVFL
jgi:hypothetical protein